MASLLPIRLRLRVAVQIAFYRSRGPQKCGPPAGPIHGIDSAGQLRSYPNPAKEQEDGGLSCMHCPPHVGAMGLTFHFAQWLGNAKKTADQRHSQ